VFDKPTLVTMITYCLRVPTLKLRCLAADILAAMCLISTIGHQLVLDGFSDARITQGETFRFEWLISSLEAFTDLPEGCDLEEESAVWEWRKAALGLINALTGFGVDLEMRCDLRGEMRRRGFDHAVDVRPLVRYELMSRNYWIVNRLIHL
jgi:diaphanous 1